MFWFVIQVCDMRGLVVTKMPGFATKMWRNLSQLDKTRPRPNRARKIFFFRVNHQFFKIHTTLIFNIFHIYLSNFPQFPFEKFKQKSMATKNATKLRCFSYHFQLFSNRKFADWHFFGILKFRPCREPIWPYFISLDCPNRTHQFLNDYSSATVPDLFK